MDNKTPSKIISTAREKGLEIITEDFLNSIRNKQKTHPKKSEKSINDFYAKTDDKPIY